MDDIWLLAAYDVATRRMSWISDTTPGSAAATLGAVFSPDGRTLYAALDVAHTDPGGYLAPFWWRIVRKDLQTRRPITSVLPEMWRNVGRVGMRPAVSRNGRFLAYASSSGSHVGLRLRDLHSYHERWLIREALDNPPVFPNSDPRDLVPGYAFTPDSKSLVVAYRGHIHRIELNSKRSTVIPFVADVERPMGPLTIHQFTLPDSAVRTRSVMQPALSPDGQAVAFSALNRIWVMELPNNDRPPALPRRLTSESIGEFFPSWSPDGTWIAYSTWRDGEGGAVRRAWNFPAKDGRPQPSERLSADTALYLHTGVALKGNRVVAVRVPLPVDRVLASMIDPVSASLVSLPTRGGSPHTITSLAAVQRGYRAPVDQLYFTANDSRIHIGAWSCRWDGSDQRTIAIDGGDRDPLAADMGLVLSPDGRRALLSYRRILVEIEPPTSSSPTTRKADTLHLDEARAVALGSPSGAARRWGAALQPWISWSRDGRRVIFNQGGTLFVGDVDPAAWTSFTRIDVPLTVPVDSPQGAIVFRDARVITMRDDEVIEHADLVVRDRRIVAVGATGTVAIPPDAKLLDLSGRTILPGYVDLHDHQALPRSVHPQQCWQCLLDLAFGITTARDPEPNAGHDVFTYRERERAGDLLGPRMFSTGIAYFGAEPTIETLEDARSVVHPYADYFGSETFKVYGDPLVGRRARQLLVEALSEVGLNGTAHTHSIGFQVAMALDGLPGLEHAPGTSRIYDDVARLLAQSGTTIAQTYGIFGGFAAFTYRFGPPWDRPKWRRFVPPSIVGTECYNRCTEPGWYGPPEQANLTQMIAGAGRIVAQGGRVGVGSHGDIPGLGYHYELWLYALGGMSSHEVLRAATITGATAIGHILDLGSIEAGKLADLQVLERNPLEDIQHTVSVQYVMKNGRLYRADDLTEVWPRSRALAPIYVWGDRSPDTHIARGRH